MRFRIRHDPQSALLRVAAALVAFACLGQDHSRAAGDAAKGRNAFVRQCAICHTLEEAGPNRFGPNLFGILHRKAGTVAGFNYSRAFKAAASWDWNEDLVAGWIGPGPDGARHRHGGVPGCRPARPGRYRGLSGDRQVGHRATGRARAGIDLGTRPCVHKKGRGGKGGRLQAIHPSIRRQFALSLEFFPLSL